MSGVNLSIRIHKKRNIGLITIDDSLLTTHDMNPSLSGAKKWVFYRKYVNIALTFLCALSSTVSYAQIDSLEKVLPASTGNVRAEILYILSWEYRFSDKDKALQYGEEGLQLARQLKDTAAIGAALNSISETWLNFGDYEKAEKITLEELPFARAITDKKNLFGALTRLGTIQYRRGKFDEALVYQLEVQREAEKLNKPEILGVSSLNLGLTYMDLKRNDEALEYFNAALRAFEAIHFTAGIGASYINIAEVLRNQKKYKDALETAFKGEKMLIESGNKLHLAYIYALIGKLYVPLNDNAKRLDYLQKALALSEENKDEFMISQTRADLGRTFMEAGDMVKARQYFESSLGIAEKMQHKSMILENYAHLRNWYLLQKDFAQANAFDEKFTAGMDSVFNTKMVEKVADSETKYETEKKESAIRDLENRNRIQNIRTYSALSGIVGLLVLLYLMRRAYRQKQRLAEQQEQLQRATIERLETERKVVALNAHLEGQQLERLRIAEDLHDDFGSGLSKISLLSKVVKRKTPSSGELDKISASAKELLLKMGEIVWALNYHNDTLPSLAAYIRRYAGGFFEDSGIRCFFDIPDLPAVYLSGEQRRNVFLVVKETLHNTLKHAEAGKVDIIFVLENNILEIRILDNGKGFDDTALEKAGNGLANMERRMQAMGGNFEVSRAPGKGTVTRIGLPLKKEEEAMVVAA